MHRSLLVGSLVATAVLVPATVLVDAGPGGRVASASELPRSTTAPTP
jgi:hypothetical protein